MTLFFTLLEELFVQIAYKLIDLNLWLLVFSGFGWSVDTDRALIEVIAQPSALLGTRQAPSLHLTLSFPLWQCFCSPVSHSFNFVKICLNLLHFLGVGFPGQWRTHRARRGDSVSSSPKGTRESTHSATPSQTTVVTSSWLCASLWTSFGLSCSPDWGFPAFFHPVSYSDVAAISCASSILFVRCWIWTKKGRQLADSSLLSLLTWN